jgi:hypothetical protein
LTDHKVAGGIVTATGVIFPIAESFVSYCREKNEEERKE